MEKKDLLGVRKRPPPAATAAAKRRRMVVTPAKAAAGAGAVGIAKAVAAYLASDSYMYAPLVSAPPSPPPPPEAAVVPSAAPHISTPGPEQHEKSIRKEGGLSELVGTEEQDQPHACTWLRGPHLHGLPTGFGYRHIRSSVRE